ncbi:hypothetical protein EL18_02752 [Nitratireductor basaltis]|uniref:DUF1402 family protein n=1 Tax=Nitratireductor basaltis TaxID=472175 RepID=A0A084U6B5_9HYPH|nr:DUF1402 family protein [Nitratireductor basaltis]KFB08501.1 hypothetical protein EL18_02752 [Nitratireductor basaltis]
MRHSIVLSALIAIGLVFQASAATHVPPGNRNEAQPPIPRGSAVRTNANKTTYDRKFEKVRTLLETDRRLQQKIKSTAKAYGVDPIHIVGAIVGEHTYNVDAYDHLQTYYVKAVSYLKSSFTFSHNGELVHDFISRPEFSACEDLNGSYAVWSCREQVWNQKFRGKSVGGTGYPDERFSAVFFQPFYAGQTFGIGQLNPLTALQLTDTVNKVSGYPKLSHTDPQGVYKAIMDPDVSLAYVAATLKHAIQAYRRIAGFDISSNPGVTATLYNLGDPEMRARKLASENAERKRRGEPQKLPEENYYGWLVNDRMDELQQLVARF